jgi:hypothetical protein
VCREHIRAAKVTMKRDEYNRSKYINHAGHSRVDPYSYKLLLFQINTGVRIAIFI